MPVVILLIGYAIFTLVVTVNEMYTLSKEEKNLKNNLTELKKDAENLKTEIDKLSDDDYIARYARENYLYTKDGEYVIKVPEKEEKKKEDNFKISEDLIFYGIIGLIVLTIIYIIHRHHKKNKKKR